MQKEIWKDIEGYEGLYKISNFGNVINKNYKSKEFSIYNSYFTVSLYKNSKIKRFYVHRLVAQHFIPNTENKEQVNHIDFNRLNNSFENLNWMSAKENVNYSSDLGRYKNNGPKKGISTRESLRKIIIQFDKKGNFIREWKSIEFASLELDIPKSSICSCCKGRLKTAGGFKWSYKEIELVDA